MQTFEYILRDIWTETSVFIVQVTSSLWMEWSAMQYGVIFLILIYNFRFVSRENSNTSLIQYSATHHYSLQPQKSVIIRENDKAKYKFSAAMH